MRQHGKAAVVGGVAMAMGLAGCATMSPDQCRQADWRAVGYADGVDGQGVSRLQSHVKACAKANVVPDQSLYQAGRTEGLRVFCTPERGWEVGLEGRAYEGVCPADLDIDFRSAYRDGARAYQALSALRSVESAISSLRSERDDLERKISANEAGLLESKSDEERARHRNELIRLREARARLDGDLRGREGELRYRAEDVARLRGELRRWGVW